jgi:hypothetical protein
MSARLRARQARDFEHYDRLNIGDKVCPIPGHRDHERDGLLAVAVRHAHLDMPATPQQIWQVIQAATSLAIEAEHATILYGSMDRQALDAAYNNSADGDLWRPNVR